MAEGISPNPLNKITQVYLDRIAKINNDPEIAQKEREKWQSEAKVDTGSAEEKATARNKRNTPAGKDSKFDTSVFITRKPGESLDSARTRKRREAHDKKRGVKENFSSWRNDLREIVDEIESKAEKEVTEKKVKNKVVINPKLTETVEGMGGQLLEVSEVEDDGKDDDAQKADALKKKEAMLKKRIVRMKMQAVNQGAGENIIASYDPLESAVDYFYEEGINEEGIDLIIEEIGIEDFISFVNEDAAVALNEERAARKMNVRTKSSIKKQIAKDAAAEAKRKEKKTGEYAEKPTKKAKLGLSYATKVKPEPKKEAPKPKKIAKPVAKKVEKAVAKVKPAQPKKEVSKDGIRDKIKSAVKAGVKRHKKAVQPARVFVKGMKSGAKSAVKFAGKAQKALVGEDYETKKKGEVLKALDKKKFEKKYGKEKAPDIMYAVAAKTAKKKGDTSKSDDRYAYEEVVVEKDLNAAERRALPDKEFALPGKGKGPEGKQAGSYPIPDKSHARMALAMVAKHGTPEKKEKVRAAVAKKFPGIQQEAIERQAKDRKKLSQPHSVSGSRRDHSHDVDSALTDYVPRKGKGRMRPASKKEMRTSAMREDKAFDNVVGVLRKKYGKDAVLTKDSPKPKAQPRPKAKPDTRTPEQKKRDQDHANVMARYGGEANYKAGRGLGT